MTHDSFNDTNGRHDLPPELECVAGALDSLGQEDRDAAPAGLEDRIFMRTRSAVAAQAQKAAPAHSAASRGPIRIEPMLQWRWRLAAGIAIAAATVLTAGLIVNRNPAPSSSTLSDEIAMEIDEFLEITSDMESQLAAGTDVIDLQSIGLTDDFWGDDSDTSALLEDTL